MDRISLGDMVYLPVIVDSIELVEPKDVTFVGHIATPKTAGMTIIFGVHECITVKNMPDFLLNHMNELESEE